MNAKLASQYARVIIDAPLPVLDYRIPESMSLVRGDRVIVPLKKRKVAGIVTGLEPRSLLADSRIRSVQMLLAETRPLSEEWLDLTRFAASYYMGSWGEAALPALPPFWRRVPGVRHAATVASLREVKARSVKPGPRPQLNENQRAAVQAVLDSHGFQPFLLFGVTGSGKTEVYLHIMEEVLKRDPQAQVLLLVPEINLTPQLEYRVRSRFTDETVVTLHSELSLKQRAANWLAVHEGRARVLVGTRMAVFASFQKIALLIVDEEHDTSYKAGDGLHYSARDLAVKRAQMLSVSCVLGSATPSLETWARAEEGKYRLLRLDHRAVAAAQLPKLTLSDTRHEKFDIFTASVRQKIDEALERKEQVLIFVNRRGYAPVLTCTACGWVSRCRHCSGFTVFHKAEKKLVCHHCGTTYEVPQYCPCCGNAELEAVGTGTQKIEEGIEKLWPQARLLRIDRDSVRAKGEAEAAFKKVHAREVDIVVGTQMIAKGHDFQHVSLVVVLNADAQLVSPDIRAEERLFATLMQVAGRAGRGDTTGEIVVQTRFPEHPVFAALAAQSYEMFAGRALGERREMHAPPFVFQALMRAEAQTLERAVGFLQRAAALAADLAGDTVFVYDPVPMSLMRFMDTERAQLLVEADSRTDLHRFLNAWKAAVVPESGISWQIEVDPQEV